MKSKRSTPSMLRLLLWPILWWGFSRALYCAPAESVVQLAPPAPLAIDLSGVSEDDIAKTVLHLQQLVRDSDLHAARADAKLAVAGVQLIFSKVMVAALQGTINTLARERDDAVKREGEALKREREWRTRARWLMSAVSILIAAALSRFTKLLPFPWNWIATAGIAAAAYAALYTLL